MSDAGERPSSPGLPKVPAVIRNVSDDKVLELALIENIQREDLNPIEEARAYKKLIDTMGLTQETVAERVGRDRSYVTNYLRLLAPARRPTGTSSGGEAIDRPCPCDPGHGPGGRSAPARAENY